MQEMIDREVTKLLLDIEIGQFGEGWLRDGLTKNGLLIAKRIVSEQPTIEAEPVRHGWWIKIEPSINLQSRWKCSRIKCGGIVHAITDYCPNCGARMDGGADNDKT